MKLKIRIILYVFLMNLNFSFGQNVYEWYQDGIVIFQIKTASSYTIPSRDKIVDLKQVDFLQVLQEKYGIYEAKQLHPSDPDERLRKTYQIQFTQVDRVDALIRDISSISVIEYAEKKELHRHFLTPNDLGANSSTTTTGMWHLYRMNAQQAWDLSTGDANVKVAVTDDAIRTTHVDLVNKVVASHDATTGGSDANPCGNNDGNHGTHV
jgi:subtilisin family serine protease